MPKASIPWLEPLPPAVTVVLQCAALWRVRTPFTEEPHRDQLLASLVLTALHDVYVTPGNPASLHKRLKEYRSYYDGMPDDDEGRFQQATHGVDLVVRHWRKHPTMPDNPLWRAELLDPSKAWTWADFERAVQHGLRFHYSPRPEPVHGSARRHSEPETTTEAPQPIDQRALVSRLFEDPPTNKE